MIDMEMQFFIKKVNEVWKVLAEVLDDNKMSLDDSSNLMLTINARWLSGLVKILDVYACNSEASKKLIKREFLLLLDEKLGS